jgi:aspartyl aminopeptidase
MSEPSAKRARILSNTPEGQSFAEDFIQFLNESCTAFHAVQACKERLLAAGFHQLSESKDWSLSVGGKYFFTRNGATVIAFTVGSKYEPTNGFTVLGAHTDSPCFKVKPVVCTKKGDSLMINTMNYGGGLWHTWFDRDLGIAGRVVIKGPNGELTTKLLRIDDPIARIPTLAIHLSSAEERKAFAPNLHEHCQAILSMDPEIVDMKPSKAEEEVASRLHPVLLRLAADQLKIEPEAIEDMELQLIDTQPSAIGGAGGELLFSGRLDNLCSTYQSLRAIIDTSEDMSDQTSISMAMMFDHEEVGSSSCTGAGSSLFMDTIKCINAKLADTSSQTLMKTLKKSFVVSIDMAHARHPNYQGKHDPSMYPKINGGLVIKTNANQRYATHAVSATIFRRLAKMVDCPMQEFTVRNDAGCGSTIGPVIATLSGIMTIDVGTPQFSMHSIREMMGTEDAYNGYKHLSSVLVNYPAIQAKTTFD